MAASDHDVVIIGSGASGGMAAWNLTRKGAKVLMLEAGGRFERADFWSHVKPWEERERRRRGERSPGFETLPLRESPYETPARPALPAAPGLGRWRQDQHLGAGLAALRRPELQRAGG